MDASTIGTAAAVLGPCIGGFWVVWVRITDKLEKLREHVDAEDGKLRLELASGKDADAARDKLVAVLEEAHRRSESEVARNLQRIYERLDQLAGKLEAHMAGEASEVRKVLDEWGRRELPRMLARLRADAED